MSKQSIFLLPQRLGFAVLAVLLALTACNGQKGEVQSERGALARDGSEPAKGAPDAASAVSTLDQYKVDLARRISQVNAVQVHTDRPQALLRSVIVIRYVVDQDGRLVRSNVVRGSRDKATEATALASLRKAAPFPRPPVALLGKARGSIELSETWLFNDDGRFQLRSIALPQLDH